MTPKRAWKDNRIGIFAFLFAIVLVLISSGSGEASAHSHAHKAIFSNDNIDPSRSCPLIHHPERDICPTVHHAKIGDVLVIKTCGNGSAEGVSTGFSKETVVIDTFDSHLTMQTSQLPSSTLLYKSRLSDSLDHPPKSL